VIKHYLRTWFVLDAVTIFVPGTFDIYLATLQVKDGEVSLASNISILRVFRCIRLVKLVRLIRASRVYERWKARVSISYAAQTLIQCLVLVLLGAHWYSCVMALQTSMHGSPQDTWISEDRYNFCEEDATTDSAALVASSDVSVNGCESLTIGRWYIASFTWSIMIITGTGGTDFYPSSDSDGENMVVTLLVIVGALIWTQVLAKFCDMATNSILASSIFGSSWMGSTSSSRPTISPARWRNGCEST